MCVPDIVIWHPGLVTPNIWKHGQLFRFFSNLKFNQFLGICNQAWLFWP